MGCVRGYLGQTYQLLPGTTEHMSDILNSINPDRLNKNVIKLLASIISHAMN